MTKADYIAKATKLNNEAEHILSQDHLRNGQAAAALAAIAHNYALLAAID